jgi:hypothetical protein
MDAIDRFLSYGMLLKKKSDCQSAQRPVTKPAGPEPQATMTYRDDH